MIRARAVAGRNINSVTAGWRNAGRENGIKEGRGNLPFFILAILRSFRGALAITFSHVPAAIAAYAFTITNYFHAITQSNSYGRQFPPSHSC